MNPILQGQVGPKPLAAAALRLRGRPGRPRKTPDPGQRPGIGPREVPATAGPGDGAVAQAAIVPRLLGVKDAARYLGVSEWTLRDMPATVLPRVRLPGQRDEVRRLLFDRDDLDRLVMLSKETGA